MMTQEEKIKAEDAFVKIVLLVSMVTNQYQSAYSVLTRLPGVIAKKAEEYKKTSFDMRQVILESRTGQEQKEALMSLDSMNAVFESLLKVQVDPEAIKTIKDVLDLQASQVQEMLKNDLAKAPGVQ